MEQKIIDSCSGRRPCASMHMTPKIGIRADFSLSRKCSIKKTLSPAVCPQIFSAAREVGGNRQGRNGCAVQDG